MPSADGELQVREQRHILLRHAFRRPLAHEVAVLDGRAKDNNAFFHRQFVASPNHIMPAGVGSRLCSRQQHPNCSSRRLAVKQSLTNESSCAFTARSLVRQDRNNLFAIFLRLGTTSPSLRSSCKARGPPSAQSSAATASSRSQAAK